MNTLIGPALRATSSGPITVVDDVTEQLATGAADALIKPRLRGWIHLYCAVAAAIAGTALVVVSWAAVSKRAGHSTLAYTAAIVAMFAVSAIYHRVDWQSATTRTRMRQLDHSMIFVFIAGSYTPFVRLAMPRATGHVVLAIVWGAALGRSRAGTVVAHGAALGGRAAVSAAGLGGGLLHRDDLAQRRDGRTGTAGCRRRAVQHWRGVLWIALA